MPKIDLDGVNIYYEDVGEGFPLVLLHPWPTDHAMWLLQVPVFSQYYRVITPDGRGFGKSDRPDDAYDLKTLSDDVYKLLERLSIEKAFVVGNSLGASVAQKFAIEHTDKTLAAVWVGAPTYPLDDLMFVGTEADGTSKPFADVYLDALRTGGYLHFWKTIWEPTMPTQFNEKFVGTPVGSYLVKYLFENRYAKLNRDPGGTIRVLEALTREKSMLERLKQLKVPAALVTAEYDDTLTSCKVQHEACPQFEYLVIEQGGHFCMMDNAEAFNDFLLGFLRKARPD